MNKPRITKLSGDPKKDFLEQLAAVSGKPVRKEIYLLYQKAWQNIVKDDKYLAHEVTTAKQVFDALPLTGGLLTVENVERFRVVLWQDGPVRASFASVKPTIYQAMMDCLSKAAEFNAGV